MKFIYACDGRVINSQFIKYFLVGYSHSETDRFCVRAKMDEDCMVDIQFFNDIESADEYIDKIISGL